MPVVFELKPSTSELPLDVRGLIPEKLQHLSIGDMGELPVAVGNVCSQAKDHFSITGSADGEVIFRNSSSRLNFVGFEMSNGLIEIVGDAGRHVGNSMSGGELIARGNVSDFAGAEMNGGVLVVHGNAGNHVGGSYPGASFGMNRGTILVAGNTGKGTGYRMRRGTIVIGGAADGHTGWQMRAGTIVVFGNAALPLGVDMKRGTIMLHQGSLVDESQLSDPAFVSGSTGRFPIAEMLNRWIDGQAKKYGLPFPQKPISSFRSWHGDQNAGGRGEIFSAANEN